MESLEMLKAYCVLIMIGPRYDKKTKSFKEDGIILSDNGNGSPLTKRRGVSELLALPLRVARGGTDPGWSFYLEAGRQWGEPLRDRLDLPWNKVERVPDIAPYGRITALYTLRVDEKVSHAIARGSGSEHDMIVVPNSHMPWIKPYYNRDRPETRSREMDRCEYSYMYCDELYVLEYFTRRVWPEQVKLRFSTLYIE